MVVGAFYKATLSEAADLEKALAEFETAVETQVKQSNSGHNLLFFLFCFGFRFQGRTVSACDAGSRLSHTALGHRPSPGVKPVVLRER